MVVRVLVAGGTGVVGRPLVARLVERGHQVTATTTAPARLGLVEELGAEGVVMDGLAPRSVAEVVAAARPEVVVHQMTAIGPVPDMRRMDRWFATTNRLRTTGTDNLLAAAEAADVRHVVAQSYAGWNGLRRGGWVKTEDDPLDLLEGTAAHPVMEALQHVETAVGRAGGTVLRYGWLYGPGASDSQVDLVRSRRMPVIGRGQGHCSWVHVDDAAGATVLAVEQCPGGVFDIVDDEPAPARDWLPHLAACVGAKPPMHVPAWLARLLAGDVAVTAMTEGRGFSNAKARRVLGWQLQHPSWRQGFAEALT